MKNVPCTHLSKRKISQLGIIKELELFLFFSHVIFLPYVSEWYFKWVRSIKIRRTLIGFSENSPYALFFWKIPTNYASREIAKSQKGDIKHPSLLRTLAGSDTEEDQVNFGFYQEAYTFSSLAVPMFCVRPCPIVGHFPWSFELCYHLLILNLNKETCIDGMHQI